MAKPSASSARGTRAARSGHREIDYSDIPELSDHQLHSMRRVGRPPLGTSARQLIAIRIDPEVLRAVKRHARRKAIGYQTLINEILAEHANAAGERRVAP